MTNKKINGMVSHFKELSKEKMENRFPNTIKIVNS